MLTLSPQSCLARRQRLITSAQADVYVINNPRHIFYFTGMFATQLLLSAWGLNSLLIDGRSGRATLIAHDAISAQAAQAHVDERVIYKWYVSGHAAGAGGDLFGAGAAALVAALADSGARVVGYERGWLPYGAIIGDGVDLNATLATMRRSKDADELALIREAIRVTEAGHRAARSTIRPAVSELDVFNAIQAAMTLEFGHAVHMIGDFVSGERAREIGGFATDRLIRAGDVMIIDAFPIVNGYRADFTATIAATPDVTTNQRRLDTALHEAMAAAETLLRAGTVAGDVYRAVRGVLEAQGFAAYFPHHAGHGLGLDHPEAPYFVPDSDEVLQAGDVVTVEPGAYGEDFAGRIENNYLITQDGFEKLTTHDTRLIR